MSTIIAIINCPFIFFIVPFVLSFWIWILKYFLNAYRDLKRLEAMSQTPILSHFSETLNGSTTIRAYEGKMVIIFIQNIFKIIISNFNF